METAARTLVSHYTLSHSIVNMALGDLSDAQAKARARQGSGPSIAWIVGHLCHWKIRMLALLGRRLDNPFAAHFDSAPANDGAGYPSLGELRAAWTRLHNELSGAVAEAPASLLEARAPDAAAHEDKRVQDTLLFFAWHEAYHVGTLSAVRLDLGLKGVAELG